MCIHNRSLPEVFDIGHSLVEDCFLRPQLPDLQLEQADVLHPLVVLDLTLVHNGLLDLDLLIKQCQFIVPPHQLSPENVPLATYLNNKYQSKQTKLEKCLKSININKTTQKQYKIGLADVGWHILLEELMTKEQQMLILNTSNDIINM